MIALLEKLGLSEKEAKVYLACLELGEDTVQNIATKAGVNRATTYVILEKLLDLGLASTYEKNPSAQLRAGKTVFVAQDPKELTNLIKEEKEEIEEREKNLNENLNQLTAIFNQNRAKPVVRFFEGADGLEALDRYGRNLLKRNSEILSVTPIDLIEEFFPERRKKSLGERVKLGIKARTIYTHKDGEIDNYKNQEELRDAVFIPRDKFPINASLTIYPGWGVKLYYYNQTNPYGVALESKELSENLRLFFELAWFGSKHMEKKSS